MQSILRVDPITDAVMVTQAEVLRGMPVIEQVADRLNLHTNPEFNASLRRQSWWRAPSTGAAPPADTDASLPSAARLIRRATRHCTPCAPH